MWTVYSTFTIIARATTYGGPAQEQSILESIARVRSGCIDHIICCHSVHMRMICDIDVAGKP